MRGIRRLLILLVLAVVAFAVALISLGEDARQACATEGKADTSYAVKILGPLSTQDASPRLSLTHDGEPVTDAQVCLRARMEGTKGAPVSGEAQEAKPGIYDLDLRFQTSGTWEATVLVDEGDGQRAVTVTFDVSSSP